MAATDQDCTLYYTDPATEERYPACKGEYSACLQSLAAFARSDKDWHPDDWAILSPSGREMSWVL